MPRIVCTETAIFIQRNKRLRHHPQTKNSEERGGRCSVSNPGFEPATSCYEPIVFTTCSSKPPKNLTGLVLRMSKYRVNVLLNGKEKSPAGAAGNSQPFNQKPGVLPTSYPGSPLIRRPAVRRTPCYRSGM